MNEVQLNDRQAAFVHFMVKCGKDVKSAAELAGYSELSAYEVLKRPAVAHAIHAAMQQEFVTVAAPTAYRILQALLLDKDVSARVRADIGFKFIGLGGHAPPSSKEVHAPKALSEMTRAEMIAHIEKNAAEIEAIERALSDQATDVSAPVTRQPGRVVDAKPLDYLD